MECGIAENRANRPLQFCKLLTVNDNELSDVYKVMEIIHYHLASRPNTSLILVYIEGK